jgi:hypothetical protein
LLLCLVGAFFSPAQFFRSYLLAYLFWLGIALGCLAIVMIQYLSGGAWGLFTRRILESGMGTLPYLAVLFIPILIGFHHLYLWARPEDLAHDAALQHKHAYLNVPFFVLRTVLYFGLWVGMAYLLNIWSVRQDHEGSSPRLERRFRLLSGPGLVLYVLAGTFAAIDWVMSLEPHWSSTIFGISLLVGQGLNAFAFTIAVAALLARQQPLSDAISPKVFKDLGNLLLSFVMLWAYMAFSQYLLIWSGNLPEEATWYVHRLRGGWWWIGLALIVLHFAVPFVLLLSRDLKRNFRTLAMVAVALMAMRLVDIFWLVTPAFVPSLRVHWLDVAAPVGLGGLWLALFLGRLRRQPLLPAHDPQLEEAIAYGRS